MHVTHFLINDILLITLIITITLIEQIFFNFFIHVHNRIVSMLIHLMQNYFINHVNIKC